MSNGRTSFDWINSNLFEKFFFWKIRNWHYSLRVELKQTTPNRRSWATRAWSPLSPALCGVLPVPTATGLVSPPPSTWRRRGRTPPLCPSAWRHPYWTRPPLYSASAVVKGPLSPRVVSPSSGPLPTSPYRMSTTGGPLQPSVLGSSPLPPLGELHPLVALVINLPQSHLPSLFPQAT
jgi:hypothetical protein